MSVGPARHVVHVIVLTVDLEEVSVIDVHGHTALSPLADRMKGVDSHPRQDGAPQERDRHARRQGWSLSGLDRKSIRHGLRSRRSGLVLGLFDLGLRRVVEARERMIVAENPGEHREGHAPIVLADRLDLLEVRAESRHLGDSA